MATTTELKTTVGDRDLEIRNAPTAGYLPIIEKQVFTVAGSASDYPTTTAFNADSGVSSIDDHVELIYQGNDSDTALVFMNGKSWAFLTLSAGEGLEFDGNNPLSGKPSGDIYLYDMPHTYIKGIQVDIQARASITATNAYIDFKSQSFLQDNVTWIANNCYIKSARLISDGSKFLAFNSIGERCLYGWFRCKCNNV